MARLRCLLPVVLLVAVMSAPALSQNADQPPDSNPLRDRDAERLLKVGGELIQAKRYKSAIALLQLLLKPDTSRMFISPDGRDQGAMIGVQAEARRLLSTLPAGAIGFYEEKYGAKARSLESRVAIAAQYPLTRAGIVSEYKLCDSQYRGGQPLPGALGLSRLLKNAEARKLYGPLLHLEAAIAWARAGHRERAIDVLEDLRKSTKSDKVVVDPFHLTLYRKRSEALTWLVKSVGNWNSFRGIDREAWTKPVKPLSPSPADADGIILGEPVWTAKNIQTALLSFEEEKPAETAKKRLAELREKWRKASQLTFPLARPRIIDGRVIHRAGGRLQAVDLKTGKVVWKSFVRDALNRKRPIAKVRAKPVRRYPRNRPPGKPGDNYMTQRAWSDNAATRIGYHQESCLMLSIDPVVAPEFTGQDAAKPEAVSSVWGVDNRFGKLTWQIEATLDPKRPYANTMFLNTPSIIDDRLVGLVEQDGQVSLMTIRQERRRVQQVRRDGTAIPNEFITLIETKQEQSIPLIKPEWPIDDDPVRRFAGDRPIDAAGLIICPITNEGVIAVDRLRKQMVWAYRYRSRSDAVKQRPRVDRVGFPIRPDGRLHLRFEDLKSRWVDSVARYLDGKLLLTPRDSDELHCLDTATGKPIWTVPRGRGLYIAEVVEGRVIVVAEDEVRSYRLSDGKPGWRMPLFTSMPAGFGLRARRYYRLPLQTGEIMSFELRTGVPIARVKVPGKIGLGNLTGTNVVVSQNALHTVAFPNAKDVLAKATATLKKNPNDSAALQIRANYRLQTGRTDAGIADLRKVVKAKPGKESRAMLGTALMMKLRRNYEKSTKLIPEIEKLLTTDQDRIRFHSLLVIEQTHRRQYARALRAIIRMADVERQEPTYLRLRSGGRVRLDRWLRGRVETLTAKLTAKQRKTFDRDIGARAKAVIESKNPQRMQRFLRIFARHPTADRVRLALAELTDLR